MLLQPGLARRPRALSLMTFNVLAPCYFRHGGRVESSDRAACLSRAQALIRAIERERCDLVCLQEYWFDHEYQAAFRRAFYPTHYIHALKRPGDKEDGLAIFVNKHKFDVHHVQHIDFDHAGDRVALLLHLATKWNRHAAPLLDRSFLVVNAHLTFPHNQAYKAMRLDQIKAVLVAVRDYVTRESLQSVPILMCGDFNDSQDAVHSFVTDEGFASVFAHINGREARITHCNHNNREVGVDFVFASHLQDQRSTRRRVQELVLEGGGGAAFTFEAEDDDDDDSDAQTTATAAASRLQLVPRDCHLSPRRLADTTRLKRPSFGHDWRAVAHPEDDDDDAALVDYWRMLSDHRPLVATFDMLSPASPSSGRVV
ncbi:hypothetical protein PybrP1_003257 [[Pythium] brassicae (nom. inval.)]|nr:hypothetical protein PybrP1_003257 [[Pythium] brassicae (nom. inval.)]